MTGGRSILAAVLALASVGLNLGGGATPASAQVRDRAISRQDLALAARDLPPGYEERPWVPLAMEQAALDTRLLVRGEGSGPLLLYSLTFQAPGRGTQASADRLAHEMYDNLSAHLARTVQGDLRDRERIAFPAVGEVATMYRFRHRLPHLAADGDGALVVFAHAEYVTVLAALSTDGRSAADLRRYARIVDERLQDERG